MKLPQLALAELRRLTATPMARLALLALAIVPLLYGGIYLWANQDPYSNLDQVPAALVVEDAGAGSGDDRQNIGMDVAENVLDDGSFDWHLVNAAEAEAGVENGDYDFSLTLPETFTEDLLSASGDSPRPATIVLTTNDANSYLASTIGEQAVNRIQAQVREQVGEESAVQLLTSVQQIRDGMVDAADGAAQLQDGLATAQQGSAELETGAAQLADGTAQLADGSAQLHDGAVTLADGASQVADGNAQIAQAGNEVAAVTGQLAGDVSTVRADIVDGLEQAGLSDAQIAQVMQPLDTLGQDVIAGDARVQEVNGQLQQLSAGARQVADGAAQLSDASGQLASGASEAADGATQLHSGAGDLRGGIDQLHSGAVELREGLDDGVAQIPDSSDEQIREQAATIAAPVETNSESVTAAGTYGAGLAPFFVALAAWIGIYALMLIIKPFSTRAVTALRSPFRVGAAAWLTPAFFGVLQMVALFGVIAVWLGFTIEMPLQTLGLMMLSSMTFAAIIVALNVWLASVGQFLGLVLMVVQLVVAGGTFPWQTLPAPLAALHHLMPMSYTVDGLRQLMYGGSMAAAQTDALVLLGFLAAAFTAIVVGTARMMHHRTLRDLQPSLIG